MLDEIVKAKDDVFDYKSALVALAKIAKVGTPDYSWEHSGPAHDRHYISTVSFSGAAKGSQFESRGEGSSKRIASVAAAETAYKKLNKFLHKKKKEASH
jgi:ribonuclease-3